MGLKMATLDWNENHVNCFVVQAKCANLTLPTSECNPSYLCHLKRSFITLTCSVELAR